MAKDKLIFTNEEFIETQTQIFGEFTRKLNDIFIKLVCPRSSLPLSNAEINERNKMILLELVGVLRQTFSWYVRINKAMLYQNRKRIPKQKKALN